MRLALVSTYPPAQCGIGYYSADLVHALARRAPDVEVVVLAEPDAWRRDGDWVGQLTAAIARVQPDVVHVQHEQGILGRDARLAELLRAIDVPSIVTLHSVYADRRARAFHRRLADVCDRIVVHQRAGMASVLAAHGVPEARVAVIACGTPELAFPGRAAARELLELPADAPIALFFGFIHTGKRLHVAIDAFERAARELPDARFVIAGRINERNVFQRICARWLRGRMRAGIAAGRIVLREGFVPVEHKSAYYAAADVVVLPHVQAYGSASAVLHDAIAARRAFACTRGKKFVEAVDALSRELPHAFPPPGDRAAWTRALVALLGSERERDKMIELAGELAEATSFSRSAEAHAEIYRALAPRARERAAC